MIKLSTHWLKKNNQLISIRHWQSKKKPFGVIHILHGMMEYSGMYHDWARHLCLLGWDVVCHDQPGSGYTVTPNCKLDHLPSHGDTLLLDTIKSVDDWIRENYPNKPIVRYGHSMGAFLALNCSKYQVLSDAIILTGTTYEPYWLLSIQRLLVKACGTLFGKKKPSKIAHAIAISSLNSPFKSATSPHTWVSRMPKVLKQYTKDPLCGNIATWGYYEVLTNILIEMVSIKATKLPAVLILTGEKDALSNGGKKIKPLIKRFKPMTTHLNHVIIPGAHHKIESDEKTSLILATIKGFLEKL